MLDFNLNNNLAYTMFSSVVLDEQTEPELSYKVQKIQKSVKTKQEPKYKALDISFDEVNTSAIKKFIDTTPELYFKNIHKKKKTEVCILPQTDVLHRMLQEVKIKRARVYNEQTICSLMQNSNLFYTRHSLHSEDKNTVLSWNFRELYFKHLAEANKIFNSLWKEEFKGSSYSGEASSWSRKLDKTEAPYIDKKEFNELIHNVLHKKISLDEYNTIFMDYMDKVQLNKKAGRELKYISSRVLNKGIKEENEQKTTKDIHYKRISNKVQQSILEGIEFYEEKLENPTFIFGADYHSKRYRKRLLELKNLNDTLTFNPLQNNWTSTFEASTSIESGRIFNPFNRLSKPVRTMLFQEGIELDIDNMAFKYMINEYLKHKEIHNLKVMDYYTKNNENKVSFRREIAKNLKITQAEAKTYILKILFGANRNQKEGNSAWLRNLRFEVEQIKDILMQEFDLTKKEAYSKLSKDFMLAETKVMNTLLQKMNLTRDDVVDVHDGVIIPYELIKEDTIQKVHEVQTMFNVTFSGKVRLNSYIKFTKIKSLIKDSLIESMFDTTKVQIDKMKNKITNLIMEENITYEQIEGTNFFDLLSTNFNVKEAYELKEVEAKVEVDTKLGNTLTTSLIVCNIEAILFISSTNNEYYYLMEFRVLEIQLE